MQKAFLSTLSILMIANGTIKSSHLLKSQYNLNLAILPHNSLSITTFQNIWFKKIDLIHFSPITFNGCIFGSSSVFIQSKETLILQNCVNLSGHIKAENNDIFVNSSSLSENFEMFHLINSHGTFQKSVFSTSSNKPVMICSKSEVFVHYCNFSNCETGGIVTLLHTNLTVSNSFFYKMKAKEGAAINFVGDELIIKECSFLHCIATKSGGALKISGRLNSTISTCYFNYNNSPQGNSIYLMKSSILFVKSSYFPPNTNEIYNAKKNINLGPVTTKNNTIGANFSTPTPSFTQSQYFSKSSAFYPSDYFTGTDAFSLSSQFSQSSLLTSAIYTPTRSPAASPNPTSTPAPTASYIDRSSNRSKKYLTFVIIICAAVVVIAIVAVTAILLQKRKSQIYPSDYDGEDEEPKKTTVVISNINDDDL